MSNATRESEGFRSMCVSVLLACLVSGAVAGDTGCGWKALGGHLGDVPRDLVIYDNGSGPQPHACFSIDLIPGVAFSAVQGWNGLTWEPLGPAPGVESAFISELAVFDDGSGPALFAHGQIDLTNGRRARIARWDGVAWIAIDPDLISASFRDMIVFDDGSGPALYGGGGLVAINGVLTEFRLAKFDGSEWTGLSTGLDGSIDDLEVFDDGNGDALYAVGTFTINGTPAQIARLDGTVWTAVGGLVNQTSLRTLAVFDDGSGPALYAAGHSGLISAPAVVRWDGSAWQSIDAGLEGHSIITMISHDDGTGPALYAGGYLERADGVDTGSLARWDGASWSPVGDSTPISEVFCMTADNGTNGPFLYIGGTVNPSIVNPGHSVSRWTSPLVDCSVDFDGNCLVNFFDVRAFLALFTAQDPAADFNGDGLFNFVDVSDFVDAFMAGCP